MNPVLKGVYALAERLGHPVPEPLGTEHIIPVQKNMDVERDRDERARDIIRMQAEGSVLPAAGDIDTTGFELIDENHPCIKDD